MSDLKDIAPAPERTKDGIIKDFSVPDAHHLYIQVVQLSTGKIVRREALALAEPWELHNLHRMQNAEDPGVSLGKKWAVTSDVIKALLENGDCIQMIPPQHPVFRFEYLLKPMRFADNLKHKG